MKSLIYFQCFLEKLIKIQSRDPTLPGKSDYVDPVGLGMQQRAAAYSALAAKQKVSTALNNVYHTQHKIHDMVYDEHFVRCTLAHFCQGIAQIAQFAAHRAQLHCVGKKTGRPPGDEVAVGVMHNHRQPSVSKF